jgi:hypothetical protein
MDALQGVRNFLLHQAQYLPVRASANSHRRVLFGIPKGLAPSLQSIPTSLACFGCTPTATTHPSGRCNFSGSFGHELGSQLTPLPPSPHQVDLLLRGGCRTLSQEFLDPCIGVQSKPPAIPVQMHMGIHIIRNQDRRLHPDWTILSPTPSSH